ncbi:uncharacterized protein BYT42DRAFT_80810 [Radiomyces spectabilis]|uniref:uncharacterized protein n=1 Tax=Radiomyces spectabilis TaxID=64574 RepID=UPI00221F6489|nr:uncharacterized protein BYT42DRAFT_80810 [Radiomyces spectabilis]KAI8371757.1 hypothetical protein BYT42DRAFT_80810 [Radiomyces spectabilis]
MRNLKKIIQKFKRLKDENRFLDEVIEEINGAESSNSFHQKGFICKSWETMLDDLCLFMEAGCSKRDLISNSMGQSWRSVSRQWLRNNFAINREYIVFPLFFLIN